MNTLLNQKQKEEKLNYSFVFDISETATLIEDIDRKILLVNSAFLSILNINDTQNFLNQTHALSLFEKLSYQFENPDSFIDFFAKTPQKLEIVYYKTFTSIEGEQIVFSFYPFFKANEFQGNIWTCKKELNKISLFSIRNNNYIEESLNVLPNEIAIFNIQSQFLFVNKAYINSSQKRLWAKGKTLLEYYRYENLPTDTALFRTNIIAQTLEHKKPISWNEQTVKNKNLFLRTCYPVVNEKNEVDAIIELAINITLQKKLEEKLEQSVEKFYKVVNGINTLVIETNHKLKIDFLNDYWHFALGISNENFNGKSLYEILDITHYEMYEKVFAILNGAKQEEKGIIKLHDRNNNLKQYQYNLHSNFSVEENKKGIVATLTDITSEILQEEQLLELIKKEKELNELKSAFVNMVSHELRTPLTVISSSAEILELMLQSGKSYEEVTIYTQQIVDEVEKMTLFMQDLLMVSKIEAGKINIDVKETDIVGFVQDILNKSFNPWKDGRKANFILKRNNKKAQIDAGLLEHALQNILQNAFKYSNGKSDPLVRLSFANTYFTISVVDSGIGIHKNETNKLFTSFFRASNTDNIAGTGIGLMVSKYFTEQHKGQVLLKSKVNVGSIFTIKVPYSS
jgi:signal transduction histidine kinase